MAMNRNDIKLRSLEAENGKEELQEKREEESDNGDALETVLYHVGEFGTYQKLLFVAMLPFGFFFAFVYFVQMFVTATPQRHWCHVPELAHLEPELRRNLSIPTTAAGEWERCEVFTANWSFVLQTLVPPTPDTPRVACRHGWDFDHEDIPYATVTSERFWVCGQSGLAPLAQSLFFVGSIIGGLVFGMIADKFGRVPALIGSNLVGCVGGVATIFTSGFLDFALCRFVVGMSFDNCFMMIYILALEYTGPRQRTWVANMSIALFFGGGCLALPWLALWVADWRKLLLFTSLPGLVVLTAPWLLPESARWLLSRGRVSQAVDVLKKFEKINKSKIPEDVLDDFLASSRQTKKTNEGMKELLRSGPLRLMLVYMLVVYMACAVVFDGLVRMSEGLGLDFFITFTLTSATEIPSVTLLAFVLDKWGRRWLTTGPMVIAGVLAFGAAAVPRGIASVSLAIMARFSINMSYNAAIQWATELLPTGARATGSSLVHVSGYVATILSPFVIYSERLWRPLPLVVLSGVAMLGGAIGLLLPETRGRPMPQTIADGEQIVRSHTFCGKAEETEDRKWTQMEALKT